MRAWKRGGMRRIVSPKQDLLHHSWTSLRQERDLQAWISHREWNMTMVKLLPVNLGVCVHCLLPLLPHHHQLHLGMVKEMGAWH